MHCCFPCQYCLSYPTTASPTQLLPLLPNYSLSYPTTASPTQLQPLLPNYSIPPFTASPIQLQYPVQPLHPLCNFYSIPFNFSAPDKLWINLPSTALTLPTSQLSLSLSLFLIFSPHLHLADTFIQRDLQQVHLYLTVLISLSVQ